MSSPTPREHVCRCGHDRDDHQSRSWQERGEKFYGQVCEHCPCKNYIEKGGFIDRMIEEFKPVRGATYV